MRHAQSSANEIQICLTAVGGFFMDEEQAPLICREKVTELLAAEDLVVNCKGSFK